MAHGPLDEIVRLKRAMKSDHSGTIPGNIAVAYRALGNRRRAFEWWRRAAGPWDGDAFVEVGYCLQYGVGVKRDRVAAMNAYRDALKNEFVTPYGWEEALYHLAVAHLDVGGRAHRHRAMTLLRRATADGDYPAASQLLTALSRGPVLIPCRCRRGLRASLGGRRQCRLRGSQRG